MEDRGRGGLPLRRRAAGALVAPFPLGRFSVFFGFFFHFRSGPLLPRQGVFRRHHRQRGGIRGSGRGASRGLGRRGPALPAAVRRRRAGALLLREARRGAAAQAAAAKAAAARKTAQFLAVCCRRHLQPVAPGERQRREREGAERLASSSAASSSSHSAPTPAPNAGSSPPPLVSSSSSSSSPSSLFVDRVFAAFDAAQNSVLDFPEFVRGLSVFHPRAPAEEKAAFAFRLYDLGKTGAIERRELRELLGAALSDNPRLRLSAEEVDAVVEATFEEADTAGDGVIHPEEWLALARTHPEALRFMTLPGLAAVTSRYPSYVFRKDT